MTGEGAVGESIAIPFIRTKRAHRKSRNGCITCKRRRVKCDEIQPECTKCRLRGLKCEYTEKNINATLNMPPLRTSSPADVDMHGSRGGEPSPQSYHDDLSPTQLSTSSASPSGTNDSQLQLPSQSQDAELARYYFDSCVHTLSSSCNIPTQHWIWQIFIPSLAFAYPTIRHGMLALTGICLHFFNQDIELRLQNSQQPQTSSRYMDAAVAHGEEFVTNSRNDLDKLDPANVDSNTASTRLLSVCAFAFFRHYRQVGLEITDEKAWTWLHLVRGVRTVHISLMESGQDVHPMIKEDMIYSRQSDQPALTASLNMQQILAFIKDTQSERFSMLTTSVNNGTFYFDDETSKQAAITAINSLLQVTNHISTWGEIQSLFRALCTWPRGLPQDFVQMLAVQNHSALAIYTHWLMLVILGENLWWLGDMGRTGIQDIIELIPMKENGMQAVLERPRQLLELPVVDG